MSEANPNDRETPDPASVPVRSGVSDWEQLGMFGHSQVVIQSQLVIDGTGGSMAVSVTVREFWSGDQLAVEVRPAMAFPADVHLALLWIEERIVHYTSQVSPF